jgi:hypothetical protein
MPWLDWNAGNLGQGRYLRTLPPWKLENSRSQTVRSLLRGKICVKKEEGMNALKGFKKKMIVCWIVNQDILGIGPTKCFLEHVTMHLLPHPRIES